MRRLVAMSLAVILTACGSHAAAPTPTNLHTATLLTQTRTPAPSSGGNQSEIFSGTASAEMGDRFFLPPQLIVTVGTVVTWTNRGQEEHTASARDRSFGSPSLRFGTSYSFTFTKPGIFQYFCMNHGDMRAQIEVR